jgi:peptide/nickel transport system ATP-binding protein
VARVCERVLVMKDGRIVEEGNVGRVFGRPRTLYARQLLGSVLLIDPDRAPLRPPPAAPLLALDQVSFSYARPGWFRKAAPARRTLDDVSVTIGRGEVVGVIGESGSGKTTLGLLIAGMMAAEQGAIRVEGQVLAPRVAKRRKDQRRRIQMIFQDPLSSLNPRQTVGTTLARPMRLFFGLGAKAARARAAELLAQLGMEEDYLDRFPRQLSGGQQQRVAIARAFAAEPDLLICDEITSALDASIQAQVLDHLLALQRQSEAAMLVITHDLSVIWKVAPRVLVLKDGKVVEEGATDIVFNRPQMRYTAGLLDSATRASRLVATA